MAEVSDHANLTEDSGRKKRKVITLEQKVEVLKRHARGDGKTKIGRDLKLHESTVRNIIKRKDEITEKSEAAPTPSGLQTATRNRSPSMIRMECLLASWIEECNKNGLPPRRSAIQAKALNLFLQAKKEGEIAKSKETFCASVGWFNRFKKRMESQGLTMPSPVKSTDDVAAAELPEALENHTEGECGAELPEALESAAEGKISDADLEEIFSMVEELKRKIADFDPDADRSMRVREEIDKAFFTYKQLFEEKKKNET